MNWLAFLKSLKIGGIKKTREWYESLQKEQKEASEARGKGGFLGGIGGKLLPMFLGITNPFVLAASAFAGSYLGEMSAEGEYEDLEELYADAMGAKGWGAVGMQGMAGEAGIEDAVGDLRTGALKSGLTSGATAFIAADGIDYLKEGGLGQDLAYLKENLWGDFMPGGGLDPSTMSLSPMEPMPAAKDYFTIESVQAGRPSEWVKLKAMYPNMSDDQLIEVAQAGQSYGYDVAIPSRHSREFTLMDYYSNLFGVGDDDDWIAEYKKKLGI